MSHFLAAALTTMVITPAPVTMHSDDPALPSVQEVLDRALEAMGGRDALEAIEVASYSVNSPHHNQLYLVRGQEDVLRLSLSSISDERMRRRGDFGWLIDMEISGAMIAHLIDDAQLDVQFPLMFHRQVLDLLPYAETAHVESMLEIDEATCIEVIFPIAAGTRHMYFSVDSGLPMQMELRYSQFENNVRTTYRFNNWHEQNGVAVFRSLETVRAGDRFPDKIVEDATVRSFFEPVDEAIFEDPPTIAALLRHQEHIASRAQREEAISRMTADEVRDELIRVAHERRRTYGTPEQLPLRIDFEWLMQRMRTLNVQGTRG